MSIYKIPFNKTATVENELNYITEAIERGHISGDGKFTLSCQQFLERTFSIPKALLTTSCTHALEMAALLLDIQKGDEVIVPSYTFVSTANAFANFGARIVFVDIQPDTLNLDPEKLKTAITPKTRAIVPVHYAGVGCEMDAICKIAKENSIDVIEDNAHGIFGKYKGQHLGTFGSLATLSFHETKNFSCGEGGALLVNNSHFIERSEIIREKGTNRSVFFRGQVDKYTWTDKGSSYLPSDILAAFLWGQLRSHEKIQEKRKLIWQSYSSQLQDWADHNKVQLPHVPEYCEQSYHMFYMVMPTPASRCALISHLKDHGILSVFHYLPLHLSPMGQSYGGKRGDCPVTESISERLLRLPFYYSLSLEEQTAVISTILNFKITVAPPFNVAIPKKKKIIHIVGGGVNQISLVKRAKAMGLRVLITDMYPNPPAREFADYFEQVDTTEKESTLEVAKKNRIDFIITDMTDVAIPTVA